MLLAGGRAAAGEPAGAPPTLQPVNGGACALDRWLAALAACAFLPALQECVTVVCAPAAAAQVSAGTVFLFASSAAGRAAST